MPEPHLKIIQKCLDGDRSAQKQLYDELSGKMMSLCLRYMGDRMTAQDMLQEGFVTMFSRLDTYKGDGSFEGWARKIFATTCLMSLRRKDALKMSDDISMAVGLQEEGLPSAMSKISYKELMGLIGKMPAGYRTIFNLFVVEGFTHREISQMTGVSEATSRSQLNRARAYLQQKIKEYYGY